MSAAIRTLLTLPCKVSPELGDRLDVDTAAAPGHLSVKCYDSGMCDVNIDTAQAVELGTFLIRWAHGLEGGTNDANQS